jgi:hypothetical protein
VQAYQEDLLTLDELRARMPDLRAKQTALTAAMDALDAQLLDQGTYLKLAQTLEDFLARLRETPRQPLSKTARKCYPAWSKKSSSGANASSSGTASPWATTPF